MVRNLPWRAGDTGARNPPPPAGASRRWRRGRAPAARKRAEPRAQQRNAARTRGATAPLGGGGKARERAKRESRGRLAALPTEVSLSRNVSGDENRSPTGDPGGGGGIGGKACRGVAEVQGRMTKVERDARQRTARAGARERGKNHHSWWRSRADVLGGVRRPRPTSARVHDSRPAVRPVAERIIRDYVRCRSRRARTAAQGSGPARRNAWTEDRRSCRHWI